MATMMRCREATRSNYYVTQERRRNLLKKIEEQQEIIKQQKIVKQRQEEKQREDKDQQEKKIQQKIEKQREVEKQQEVEKRQEVNRQREMYNEIKSILKYTLLCQIPTLRTGKNFVIFLYGNFL